jgi:SAM-dependent methyltransferase
LNRSTTWAFLSPSSTLLKFAGELAHPGDTIVLDLACGFGRNAVLMAAHGCDVIGVDHDIARLHHLHASTEFLLERAPIHNVPGQITTVCADLNVASWPFAVDIFDIVISIHFVHLELFPCILQSLRPGGHFYLETFGGQGQNHLGLPRPGEIKAALSDHVDFIYYREKAATRTRVESVSVRALARKS